MSEIPTRFFHGSHDPFDPGFVLRPRGDAYEEAWKHTDFYEALERWRPADKLSHRDAVFLVGEIDDIDLAGGSTEWCLECEPEWPVSKHDINWGSEISCLVGDGHGIESDAVRDAAQAYWSGLPHPNENVWEYLTSGMRVIRCEPYESFDCSQMRI